MKQSFITLNLLLLFVFSTVNAQKKWNPKPSWKDSYVANGFCWCDSTFDHDLDKVGFLEINGKKYNIVDVCNELKKHPKYRKFKNGDIPYNDIQCGYGPLNTAADEKGCPGRVDIGSKGCNQKGKRYDMNWLRSRNRFKGSTTNPNPSPNKNPVVSFESPSNNEQFKNKSSIKVTVNATDSDGISNVRLYLGNSLIRQENQAPYTWNHKGQDKLLNSLKEGKYTLKAIATDKRGSKTTKIITIFVDSATKPNPNPTPTGSTITFIEPLNNSSIRVNTPLQVEVKASKPADIKNIKLYLNNNQFVRQENFTPYNWNHRGQDKMLNNLKVGIYTLTAIATNSKNVETKQTIKINIVNDSVTDPDPNPQPTPTGNEMSILGQSINKFMRVQNESMKSNAPFNELHSKFTMEFTKDGKVSFKGSNGKYMSSENGVKSMTCNRAKVGLWEKFELVQLSGSNVYALKGNNGKYVCHENGTGPMNCNRTKIGAWEKFVIKKFDVNQSLKIVNQNKPKAAMNIYPTSKSNMDITFSVQEKISYSTIEIIDLKGIRHATYTLGELEPGDVSFSLDKIQQKIENQGIYIVRARLDNTTLVKKIIK